MSSGHLSGGRLIQEEARKQLTIVWDRSLDGPVGLIARYSLLEEYGVVKMYQLVGGQLPPTNVNNIIFFVRPQLELMDLIAENVHGEQKRLPTKEFHIFFFPRKSLLCEKTIKQVTDSNDFLEFLQIEQELLNCIDTDKPNSFIEDCIAQKKTIIKVLRLLCIQSLTNSGFKQKLFDYYKREIVQTYGYQYLPTLLNFEKAGLFKLQQSQRQYSVLRKALRLTVEDESEIAPKDISYVHSVYAPLSVRLAQQLVQPGG